MTSRLLLWLAGACMMLAACGGGDATVAVPRPVAYPRIEMPDSSYISLIAGADTLTVNAGARATAEMRDGAVWVNVAYDAPFSPRLALTLTDARGRVAEVMANRNERMALNVGGARCELTEVLTPGGWNCRVALARDVATTPLQLLATDGERVLSGALVLDAPDSVAVPVAYAPVVDAVRRDVVVMLEGLK